MAHKWDQKLVQCEDCPRLRRYCAGIAQEKRKSYADWEYWGRPVPNFGDPNARLLVVGLAPAAHGANRTGRMFTGDRSGEWLYKALHKYGFANQADSHSADDGLELKGALITAVAHCAPPGNKPTTDEISNCQKWLVRTFEEVPFRVVLALGGIAWTAALQQLKGQTIPPKPSKFTHGGAVELSNGRWLLGSYHPSQQNTFTGRLTEPMFHNVFARAREICL